MVLQWKTTGEEHSYAADAGLSLASPAKSDSSFTVKFTVKLTVDSKRFDAEKTLLEIPEVLTVRLRRNDPRDRGTQNYPAFKMPDGSVPVLEATLMLHSDDHPAWKIMPCGVPLAMLEHPEGEHEVVLNFTGVRWTIYVDGKLLDNDFPYGYPRWSAKNDWKIDAERVKQAEIYFPAIVPEAKPASRPAMPVQYWIPAGFNDWVGDVVTFFHDGRYHVFYLYDRRHHHSKFGAGSHYFEHLSTTDFKTWTEHEAATPIEKQWECIGTGTPFVSNGKLCIAYGLHTERIYPMNKTTMPAQQAFLAAHGRNRHVHFNRKLHAGRAGGFDVCDQRRRRGEFQEDMDIFSLLPQPERLSRSRGPAADAGQRRCQGNVGSGVARRRLALDQPEFSARRRLHIFLPLGPLRLHHRRLPRPLDETGQCTRHGI